MRAARTSTVLSVCFCAIEFCTSCPDIQPPPSFSLSHTHTHKAPQKNNLSKQQTKPKNKNKKTDVWPAEPAMAFRDVIRYTKANIGALPFAETIAIEEEPNLCSDVLVSARRGTHARVAAKRVGADASRRHRPTSRTSEGPSNTQDRKREREK